MGLNLYEAMDAMAHIKEIPQLWAVVSRILAGELETEIFEMSTRTPDARRFRSRLMAQRGTKDTASTVAADSVEAVVGITMDVAELKRRKQRTSSCLQTRLLQTRRAK